MAITSKDFKSKVTKSKVSVDIDLTDELEGLTSSQRTELKRIVGEAFIEEVKVSTSKSTAPVNQRGTNAYKPLSDNYKKKKRAAGAGTKPNLRLTKEMIESLFSKNSQNGVSLKITDSLSKKKAENHNHGVTVPKRQYLPTKNEQAFRRDIMKRVNEKVRAYKKSIK